MNKINRPPAPDFLKNNYKKWGKQYKEDKNKGNPFNWKSYEGERVNKILCRELEKITQNHCSFCDSYPLGVSAQQTIEHFRPKSGYPRLVYVWHNLFLACNICQSSKGEKYDKNLLKPDKKDYEFYRYFVVNYRNGEIEVNPSSTEEEQKRAKVTIEIYGLNKENRPTSRLIEYRKYKDLLEKNYTIEDFSYRFFLEN